MSAQQTVWTANTQVGSFGASYTITFDYCQDFTGDGLEDVKVTIQLSPGATAPGDIQGLGFDLNGDVDDLFVNGSMKIGQVTTNASYTGPLVIDVAEQNADADFNVQPEAQTTTPFDVTFSADSGNSTGNLTAISFVISDDLTDINAKALLDNTDWFLRGQAHDAGDSSKTTGTAPELNECDDDEHHTDPGTGLTPGYWKNHVDVANAVLGQDITTTEYDDFFGIQATLSQGSGKNATVIVDATLLQALGTGGGGQMALARAATAAVLNATADEDHDIGNFSYADADTMKDAIARKTGIDPTDGIDDAADQALIDQQYDQCFAFLSGVDDNHDGVLQSAEVIGAVQTAYSGGSYDTAFGSELAECRDVMNNQEGLGTSDFFDLLI